MTFTVTFSPLACPPAENETLASEHYPPLHPELAKEHEVIRAFFEKARVAFDAHQKDVGPGCAFELVVDGGGLADGQLTVSALLGQYEMPREVYLGHTPYAMTINGPFWAEWYEFAAWANAQGLRACWKDSRAKGSEGQLILQVEAPTD